MTRTRDEGVLSIKKVEEDKMNKMTIRKKVILVVAAVMAMQSMGVTAYAKEITEPTDFTSTVKQTQSKEDVLADAILHLLPFRLQLKFQNKLTNELPLP